MDMQPQEKVRRGPCSVINCKNTSSAAAKKNLSFFRFPLDKERSRKWVLACKRMDLYDKEPELLNKRYRICEEHFDDCMFRNMKKNRLNNDAYPTLFPDENGQIERRSLQDDRNSIMMNNRELEMQNNSIVCTIIISPNVLMPLTPEVQPLVCRFCLEVTSEESSTSLNLDNTSQKNRSKVLEIYNYVKVCIPTLDPKLVPNAVICDECYNNLLLCYNFQQTAVKNEQKIKAHLSVNNLSCTQLNLNDLATSRFNVAKESFVSNLDNYEDSPDYVVTVNIPTTNITYNMQTGTNYCKNNESNAKADAQGVSNQHGPLKKVTGVENKQTFQDAFISHSVPQCIMSGLDVNQDTFDENTHEEYQTKNDQLMGEVRSNQDDDSMDIEYDVSELHDFHAEIDANEEYAIA